MHYLLFYGVVAGYAERLAPFRGGPGTALGSAPGEDCEGDIDWRVP